tara:strand:- start:135 stop:698 length:564 start_codon:yes stop_codon:yes gene_type:complete
MFYVYYSESGDLLSVTNENKSDDPHLVIDKDLYVDFVSGKCNLVDYYVLLSPEAPPKFLRKDETENFDVDKSIHEIKRLDKITGYDPLSFYIFQDKKKEKWQGKAHISGLVESRIINNKYLSQFKKVYVTEENNPNILLGQLTVDMKKFTNKKLFDIETDDSRLVTLDKISLYCPVNDENFYHIVRK